MSTEKCCHLKQSPLPTPFFLPKCKLPAVKIRSISTKRVPKSFMKWALHLHFNGACCALKILLIAEGNNSAVRAECSLLHLAFQLDMAQMNYRREQELMLVPLCCPLMDHKTWRSLWSRKGRKHVALEIHRSCIVLMLTLCHLTCNITCPAAGMW